MRSAALTLVAASLISLSAHAQGSEGITREGSGARRASLDALELKPFPTDLLAGVDAWAAGAALTSGDMSGKPVIIITWASWYDPSVRALAAVQKVADQFAADGLIVVGLHENEGWDGAEASAKGKGVTFRLGHDADNKVRTALMVDQDPDVYVIDRAGQLRFADVDSTSIEQAAKIVCKETAEQAAKINETLADRAKADRVKAQSTAAINQQANLINIPELPFPEPSQEAYSKARWPKIVDQQGNPATDLGQSVLPADGWYPNNAKLLTKGRVGITYYWNPDVPATVNMVKDMDLLQRERGRDVAVAGIVVPRASLIDSSSSQMTDEQKARELESLEKRTKQYAESNRLSHPIGFNPTWSAEDLRGRATFTNSFTFVAVSSSDGLVRWWGDAKSASFRAAVDTVIENDPGVKARRTVEQAWLKARGK